MITRGHLALAIGLLLVGSAFVSCGDNTQSPEESDVVFYNMVLACVEAETGVDYGTVRVIGDTGATNAAIAGSPGAYNDCFERTVERVREGIDEIAELQTEFDERPSFSEAEVLHEEAVDGTIQCLRDRGFDASATLNFTGILYSFGIHSDGADPGVTEYEFTSGIENALDSCSEKNGVERAVDLLLEYLNPSDGDRWDIASACAASLGLDVGSASESPESQFLNVWRDEAGQACAEEAIGVFMRARAAELRAAERE